MPRREKPIIYGEILQALCSSDAPKSTTALAAAANVPYDRLKLYLEELTAQGLVTIDERPHLTPKGAQFVEHYQAWNEVLARFGLDERARRSVSPGYRL